MVFVRRLEPGNVYDVVMSRNGDSEVIGMITTQAGNASGVDRNDESADGPGGGDDGAVGSRSGHLRIDTRRGDSLPLGAESVVDLVGTTVSVNNPDGTVVLSGDIADLNTVVGCADGGDDGGDGSDGSDGADGADGTDGVDTVEAALFALPGPHDASFLRGDLNADYVVDLSDPIRSLLILFRSDPMPYCEDAADANDDGSFDVADPIATLRSLFLNAGPLPSPSEAAGFDRIADQLYCSE